MTMKDFKKAYDLTDRAKTIESWLNMQSESVGVGLTEQFLIPKDIQEEVLKLTKGRMEERLLTLERMLASL